MSGAGKEAKASQSIKKLTTALEEQTQVLKDSKTTMSEHLSSIADSLTTLANSLTTLVSANASSQTSWSQMALEIGGITQALSKGSHSSLSNPTNPFSQVLDLNTSSGIKGWQHGVQLPPSMENMDVKVGPTGRKQLRALGDHLRHNGYHSVLNIPTSGTGLPESAPGKTAGGQEIPAVNLSDHVNLATDMQNLTRDDTLKFAGFIHGGLQDGLAVPSKRVQKTLDLTTSGNDGLVANMKQQLRIRCDMLMTILQQVTNEASLNSLLAQKDLFTWTKETDGTEFYCGLTVLWLIFELIEPKTVIDARDVEKIIEETTLIKDCDGDVRTYFSTVKKARDELHSRYGTDRMNDQRFTEILFKNLNTVEQEHFKRFISTNYTTWLSEATIDLDKFMAAVDKIYTGLVTSQEWTTSAPEDPKVLALTTANKSMKKKLAKLTSTTTSAGSTNGAGNFKDGKEMAGPQGSTGWSVEKWRTIKKGDSITRPDGTQHFWCDKHYSGKGLYMKPNVSDPPGHDHAKWESFKDRQREKAAKRKKDKDDSSVSSNTPTAVKKAKLVVNRGNGKKTKFQKKVEVLVTQQGYSHEKAVETVAAIYSDGAPSDSDDDSYGSLN
mmetsp:Transcript_10109/g.15019  ORF Transcript_10109/g.15019 Transcript_10109/m.15019 type:complete len:609 (-) Transcript_10109:104-1930(-)